jgi:beta-alanine--pyruvate transaminase
LIADEVITAFGRLGTAFGSDYFGISPDIITTAKGVTNGTIPMGAVFVKSHIHDAFMSGPEWMIDFFHGYTYSGHPMACAAAIGTLDTYAEEGLLSRANELASYWEERVHAMRDLPHVIDIRNIGLIAAIEFAPDPAQPTKRAFERFVKAFEHNILVRQTGDIIALSPPLIISKAEIDELIDTFTKVLKLTTD